jgi:hypothetical protein
MEGSEEVPDPIAALDQALRACVDLARGMRAYYQACVAQGFTETQALRLTIGYQASLMTLAGGQTDA